MDTPNWIQLIITVASVASLGGAIMARLKNLEKKVDKHNSFMERLAVVENEIKNIK